MICNDRHYHANTASVVGMKLGVGDLVKEGDVFADYHGWASAPPTDWSKKIQSGCTTYFVRPPEFQKK